MPTGALFYRQEHAWRPFQQLGRPERPVKAAWGLVWGGLKGRFERPGGLSGRPGKPVWAAWAAFLGVLGACLGGLGAWEACLGGLGSLHGRSGRPGSLDKPNLNEGLSI